MSSQLVVAIELYSASADERDTVGCFLVFQETGERPNIIKYMVRERRVKGQVAQSESQ